MNIYVKFGDVTGDATHEEHENWISATAFSWGVTREVTTEVGSASLRVPSHPTVSEITIKKNVDGASAALLREATTGRQGKSCIIEVCADSDDVYCRFELENALISGVAISLREAAADEASKSGASKDAKTADRFDETVTINFTKLLFKYVVRNEDDDDEPANMFGYDIAAAR